MAPLTLKEIAKKQESRPDVLTNGHRLCAGCGIPVAVKQLMWALDEDTQVVVGSATGCLEVATTIYPYTAWNSSFIHNAFENSAATMSGVETAFRSLKKQGKIKKEFKFIAFGGDGGTYDIGFQSLSGAMERGHNMVYVCYDNGAYMNTGIQRSSATPFGAETTTSPVGKKIPGKTQFRKDLTAIMAAHNIPYVAQCSPSNWKDTVEKMKKALEVDGPAFINILAPCPRGWRYNTPDLFPILQAAVDTCYWPLFEVENGEWKLSYKPKEKKPVEFFLKPQGRFKHFFKPGNEHLLQKMQEHIDREWEKLLKRCGEA